LESAEKFVQPGIVHLAEKRDGVPSDVLRIFLNDVFAENANQAVAPIEVPAQIVFNITRKVLQNRQGDVLVVGSSLPPVSQHGRPTSARAYYCCVAYGRR
jgi:hypothetical protein